MMMRFLLFVSFSISVISSYAQGLVWEKNLSDAFQKARNQNKILFVEFYSPTCPYCKQVDPFFKEKEAGDLYNTSFINYKLDVESEEGRNFAKDANLDVYGIPYFLFFRADTTLVHAREVSANLSSVLQPGNMVVAKTYTGENYASRFENGEKSVNFLIHYALFSRVKRDLETNKKVIERLWSIYPEEKRNSSESWIIAKKATMDIENEFVNYWLKNLAQAKVYEDASAHGSVENAFARILYTTIFHESADGFSADKWQEIRKRFAGAMGDKTIFSLIWEKEVRASLREGKVQEAIDTGNKGLAFFKDEGGSLVYMSQVFNQVFNENCSDPKCSGAVEKWLASARPLLKDNAGKAAYFLEMGRLRRNQGNKAQAREMGERAMQLIKEAKGTIDPYEKFLKELSE